MRSVEGALVHYDWCPCDKRRFRHRHTQRRQKEKVASMSHGEKVASIYEPWREVGMDPANTLTLNF